MLPLSEHGLRRGAGATAARARSRRDAALRRAQSRKLLKDSGASAISLRMQRHGRLQVVALGAGDAHRVALDGGLHLQLALLDERSGSSWRCRLSMPLLTTITA